MGVRYTLVPKRGLFLLFLLALGTVSLVIAQQNQSGPLAVTAAPAGDTPEFRIVKRVDEVNLRFTVTDSHGHFQLTNVPSGMTTVPSPHWEHLSMAA